MEGKKKNTGLIVLVVILIISILGLSGYIVCDKVLFKSSQNEVKDGNCIKENNQNIIEMNYEQAYNYLVNNLNCSFYDAKSFCSDTFYISAKCENDTIKEIHYDDIIHYRNENSSGIGIDIKTKEGIYTNHMDRTYGENDIEYNMDMYYKILKSAGIKEMELINGMKYAYEISERNNKVIHDPYCD